MFYFLQSMDGTQFTRFKTDDGEVAIAVFRTADLAAQFITDSGKANELVVVARSDDDAIAWLQSVTKQVTRLVRDPTFAQLGDVKPIPLSAFLLGLDLYRN